MVSAQALAFLILGRKPLTTLMIAMALTCCGLIPGFPNDAVGLARMLNLVEADGLTSAQIYAQMDGIILNPEYGLTETNPPSLHRRWR